MKVILLPGFGGSAWQPLLVKLSAELEHAGLRCRIAVPPPLRPTPELELQTAWLASLVGDGDVALVGRSFGGRLALRAAARVKVQAVVLLGFPVRPPGKRRPLDEQLLRATRQPTLILQGGRDPLGPLRVLRPLAEANPQVALEVLPGAGHAFGRQEAAARARTVEWLVAHTRAMEARHGSAPAPGAHRRPGETPAAAAGAPGANRRGADRAARRRPPGR